MLLFDDLLLAKILAEDHILDVPVLIELAKELDETDGRLLHIAAERGYVSRSDPRIPKAHAKMRRYIFMMNDAIFTRIVNQSGLINLDLVRRMKNYQRREGFNISLRDILKRAGVVTEQNLQTLMADALKEIDTHKVELMAKYRGEDFSGIARPLTKQSKTASEPEIQVASPPSIHLPGQPQSASPSSELNNVAEQPPPESGPKGRRRGQRGTMAMSVPDLTDIHGDPEDPYLGMVIIDRYQLIKCLGQGAMGRVYLGEIIGQESRDYVAVKLIQDEIKNEEIIQRFQREILATSSFHHENIVQIYDAGELDSGAHYMVLEYIRGEDLKGIIKRDGALSQERVVDMTEQLLKALAAAHDASVMHRDVKPENFMLTMKDGRDFIKLMDFGLARILDAEEFGDRIFRTMEGQISGSPAYLAPETISGDVVDTRADLYSLGISIFEMLTAKLPYHSTNIRSFLNNHLYKKPFTLAERAPEESFPQSLEEFVARLLQKKATDRFKDCREALDFLTEKVRPELSASSS